MLLETLFKIICLSNVEPILLKEKYVDALWKLHVSWRFVGVFVFLEFPSGDTRINPDTTANLAQTERNQT